MASPQLIAALSDRQLLANLSTLLDQERQCTADVLAHLAEVDARRLFLAEGFSSLYRYAVEGLGMSEGRASHRITVARLLPRFPVVYDLVASGALHLAGLKLLAPRLTDANHQGLLAEASHKSKREIDELLAARFPRSDVLALIEPEGAAATEAAVAASSGTKAPPRPPADRPRRPAAQPKPLSADSFAIRFTIDRVCRDKLAQARRCCAARFPAAIWARS